MTGDLIKAEILAAKITPNVHPELAGKLKLGGGSCSLGLLTCTSDDVAYTALDEATKKADVKVVYAKSLYAGSGNASTRFAGEVIGIIAGPDPEEVRSGLEACAEHIQNSAFFHSANKDDSVIYYAQCISRTGSFLSKQAGIREGRSLAYLIAPPLEAVYGLDAAMKAAQVKLCVFYGPPTETNFAGGLLTGSQESCRAACDAFARAVEQTASEPRDII